jgi:hypothetical protein
MDEVSLPVMAFLDLGDHLHLGAAGGADTKGRGSKHYHQRLAGFQGFIYG